MTDTRPAKVPKNSFIMSYQSSRMYPQLEPLARKYSADKKDMANSQNVILTNGEIYFPPDAVKAIGVEKLEFMNNKSKGGAHDAIDNEMAMNLLKNIKPMYGGGMVNPSMKPMGTGGMVDAYRGGGMVMDQYGDGGMVKNKMMNYGHGGMVKNKMMMMQDGGQLKPVPEDNLGLGKLPEKVRNRMGYMQMGGKVLPSSVRAIDSRGARSILTQFSEFPEMAVQGVYEMNEPSGRGKRYYFGQGQVPSSKVSDLEKASAMALINAIQSQEQSPQDSIPLSSVLQMLRDPDIKGDKQSVSGMMKGGMVDNSLMGMMGGGMAMKKKKTMSYQDGGEVMLPPQPMDPLQIGPRQANPSVYKGSTLGAVMDQAMMLEDSIEQDTVNRARKAIQLMRLKGMLNDAELLDSPDGMMPKKEMSTSERLMDILKGSPGLLMPLGMMR